MLTELRIENFAIIDNLELRFGPGLIILTGETGAGKSIIIDAVETLLGVRADMTMLRTGVERASVEGFFRIDEKVRQPVHAILQREELLDDPDTVVLHREFRREGRNVARVNGRVVNLMLLRELGELLIDVHGQSEHLSLLRVPTHLHLLDRFAEAEGLLAEYRAVYEKLRAVQDELADLRRSEQDAARRTEQLTFQIGEIEGAKLEPGEEETLREERTRLANAESLANLANNALTALDETTPEAPAASDRVGEAVGALEGLAKIDQANAGLAERAQEIFANLSDLAREIRDYLEKIEFSPKRLAFVEERLELLHNLKRKYGQDVPAILAYAEKARADLEDITHAEERLAELEEQEAELLNELAEKGQALSARRHEAAELLSQSIEGELGDLRMTKARFAVDFRTRPDPEGLQVADDEKVAFDSNGYEVAEFLVAPNPGEGLKPLVRIASGGETSRLMLAMKNVLARADHTPTLIFDEIDQGIGGRVGAVVGQKLWNLGREHQVFCVTHLPQLAGFGDQHFKVLKEVHGGRTLTEVAHLGGEGRLMELAQMLGEVSDGTLQSANEIMQSVKEVTKAA